MFASKTRFLCSVRRKLIYSRFSYSAAASVSSSFPISDSDAPPPYEDIPAAAHGSLCLSLLLRLVRRGMLSAAFSVLDRIVTRLSLSDATSAVDLVAFLGLSPDHGRLIRSLVYSGQFLKAEALFAHATSCALSDDPSVLDAIIECLCKMGKLVEAKFHLDQMIKIRTLPSKRTYNALLRALCTEAKFLEAVDLFSLMAGAGVYPYLWCYNLLIPNMCSKGYLDQARYLFDTMIVTGLLPAARVYKSLICRYCMEGRLEAALDIFKAMKENTFLELDVYPYDTLIHCFLKLGCVDSAWELYNEMIETGLQPNVVTHSMMICWYCKNHKLDCALKLLDMIFRHGLVPDVQCFRVVTTALSKENRLVEAEQLFDKMLESGLVPDTMMLVLLIQNFPKVYGFKFLWKTLQAIAKADSSVDNSYSLVLSICSSDEKSLQEIAVLLADIMKRNLFNHMNGDTHVPDNIAYDTLIKGFCKAGRVDEALSLVKVMEKRGFCPSETAYNTLAESLFLSSSTDLAIKLHEEMLSNGYVPQPSNFL
ncbi:hypothetical protein BHE74_00016726 [Ensete ventricosum]|nr:hypothetical protein BHE74_00016726 [Ensete ventricosum]